MSFLARTICIVLCAVAGANGTTPKYRHQFLVDEMNRYDFYIFGADIVREITLRIEILPFKRPFVIIKLETNEELAKTMLYVPMLLFFNGVVGGNLNYGSYIYQMKEGRDSVENFNYLEETPLQMTRDDVIELKIFVQPSHVLLVTAHGSLSVFYGDFEEGMEYGNRDDIDAIFDSIHVDGHLIVHECIVRTGGPLIHSSEIPKQVKTFPYYNRYEFNMMSQPMMNGIWEFTSPLEFKDWKGEWEIVIRGKMGTSGTAKIFLMYGDAIMLDIVSHSSHNFISFYSKESQSPKLVTHQPINSDKYSDYFAKYSNSPFQVNTDFELSFHRMSPKKSELEKPAINSNDRSLQISNRFLLSTNGGYGDRFDSN